MNLKASPRTAKRARPFPGLAGWLRAGAALLTGGACASAPPTLEPAPADPARDRLASYLQLKPGASRTYQVRFPGQEGRRTVTVDRVRDGWVEDDQGGRFKLTSEGLRDPDRYLVRLPLEEGTQWESVLSASAVEKYRIDAVGEPCAVAAGRFRDCLVVQSRLRRDARMQLEVEWVWIRGIGLGRVQSWAVVDGKRRLATRQDLVAYDLDPGAAASDRAPPSRSAPKAPDRSRPPDWTR